MKINEQFIQVKIWFQNHRYKCKRQAKEKAMADMGSHQQVSRRCAFIQSKCGGNQVAWTWQGGG